MRPKDLLISDFTYELPDELIAKYPLPERDDSKLLIFKDGEIATDQYKNVDQHLPADTLLVFNNTRVVEARILFKKPTGGVIEIFCLEPHDTYPDITSAMLQKERVLWRCLVGGASKWKRGQILEKTINIEGTDILLRASFVARMEDFFVIELRWEPEELSFADLLQYAGEIPLPPYLHRQLEENDKQTYQTVYAKHSGSVAAPTAGLHFTDSIFRKLEEKNIQKAFVTLHVGAGTFKPVKVKKLDEHAMHAEYFEVSTSTIQTLIACLEKNVVAVGTTSLRTIESLYWIGVKVTIDPDTTAEQLSLNQWEPYEIELQDLPAKTALSNLMGWLAEKQMTYIFATTQILIASGYKLRVAKGIITNFHQPQSTLLLLIAAIVGDDWKRIYDYAIKNNFRFLSYGDGSLLWAKS
ncbi:MAG TPA: S-adenosylmethionine:tRNA ribosyltransferase-isomerase [Segetibacter sp.]